MKLSDYPRPPLDTGIGLHAGSSASHPLGDNEGEYNFDDGRWGALMQSLLDMKVTWLKLLSDSDTAVKPASWLLRAGIMPIIRMYRPTPNPGTLRAKDLQAISQFTALGVRYFETNNEPNLFIEWSRPMPTLREAVTQIVADFIADADDVLARGGLPGFPAMAPTDGSQNTRTEMMADGFKRDNYNAMLMYELCFEEIKRRGRQDIFERGGWLSLHNAGLNHPPLYPDVPQEQQEHPGSTITRHWYPDTGLPTGVSNCWRMYASLGEMFREHFGYYVPVLSTEGGFWSYPASDTRFPPMTIQRQAEYTLEVTRWFSAGQYPDYYFCAGHWLLGNRALANRNGAFENDAWLGVPGFGSRPQDYPGELPIVAQLKSEPRKARVSAGTPPSPQPDPLPVDLSKDLAALLAAALDEVGIDLNPDAALYKRARELGLGRPVTAELYPLTPSRTRYVLQGFDKGILYCFEGDWGNIKMLEWL